MDRFDPDNLKLTDFLDLATLQEIQDGFAAVANVRARITDADGNILTQPVPSGEFLSRQSAIAAAAAQAHGPRREGAEFVAPIIVNDQRLGTIRMAADEAAAPAINFVSLLANAIARLCFQEFQLRQRINELTAVYSVTMMLSDARDLQTLLDRTVQVVCEVMETKAASLRLVDPDQDELVIKAAYNLSAEYLNKGPVQLSTAVVDRVALSPKGYEYVRNMTTDPRVHYPAEAKREGIVSMLSVGMRYQGKAVGVLRVYTASEQSFTPLRINLMKALAAQAAAAIENARLLADSLQAQQLERQVQMAAEVQQRMIPQTPPNVPGLDLAAVYVPCYGLGGDFLDFIVLPYDNLGLAIADVSGKGIPASLTMASVRAALRAQVDNVYYLYEVVRRINAMVWRDAKVGEFVTLFYGVLDAGNRRLTYCNAGHPPGLLLRDGKITELGGDNMVLGINPEETYKQNMIDLRSGDLLLLYTDGLTDAMNFEKRTYGRQRLIEAFKEAGRDGASAETVAQHILWDMRRYAGLSRPTDDVTMIVTRMK
ncbi:MAG TPA: SpoIIE family protein phosphatase [Tepidisphaeraceae bacterium]|nr:SpoIIE family protein phosphatase [Tepidisphaeraceae bacterium]